MVGTDLIRRPDGRFVVIEDNLHVPSGVSYMLTGREIVKRCSLGDVREPSGPTHLTGQTEHESRAATNRNHHPEPQAARLEASRVAGVL